MRRPGGYSQLPELGEQPSGSAQRGRGGSGNAVQVCLLPPHTPPLRPPWARTPLPLLSGYSFLRLRTLLWLHTLFSVLALSSPEENQGTLRTVAVAQGLTRDDEVHAELKRLRSRVSTGSSTRSHDDQSMAELRLSQSRTSLTSSGGSSWPSPKLNPRERQTPAQKRQQNRVYQKVAIREKRVARFTSYVPRVDAMDPGPHSFPPPPAGPVSIPVDNSDSESGEELASDEAHDDDEQELAPVDDEQELAQEPEEKQEEDQQEEDHHGDSEPTIPTNVKRRSEHAKKGRNRQIEKLPVMMEPQASEQPQQQLNKSAPPPPSAGPLGRLASVQGGHHEPHARPTQLYDCKIQNLQADLRTQDSSQTDLVSGLGGAQEGHHELDALPIQDEVLPFTRCAVCATDEELLRELGGTMASTLISVKIDGIHVTLDGIKRFVQRARKLQEESVMTCELELLATGCRWENGELAALGNMALSKLSLRTVNGMTRDDWLQFVQRARKLQSKRRHAAMTREFQLEVGSCDLPNCDLPALLAGLGLSKLELVYFQHGTVDGWKQFVDSMKEMQATGENTRFELRIQFAAWRDGELSSLANLSLHSLSLVNVTGVTDTDVAVFMTSARQLQDDGKMPLDFELVVSRECNWTIHHWRAALCNAGPTFKSIDLDGAEDSQFSDFSRLVARKLQTQGYPIAKLHVYSGRELSTILELVAAFLRSHSATEKRDDPAHEDPADEEPVNEEPHDNGIAILLSDDLRGRYPAVWSVLNLQTIEKKQESNSRVKPYAALMLTGLPPMQLAVAFAAYCKEWAQTYPSAAVILTEFSCQFDQHAHELLDKCNTAKEAERLLLTPFANENLARGKLPVLDFALRYGVREFVSHPWVQSYVNKLLYSADVHFVPRCVESQRISQNFSELYTNPIAALQDRSRLAPQHFHRKKTLLTVLLPVPTLCLGTMLAAIRIVVLSLIGLGGASTVVPFSCVLGTLTAIQLELWSGWTGLLLALLAIMAGTVERMDGAIAGTTIFPTVVPIFFGTLMTIQLGLWVGWAGVFLALLAIMAGTGIYTYYASQTVRKSDTLDYRDQAHEKSWHIYLQVALAWNSPFVKFSLFCLLYVCFVLIVTNLAIADRHFVNWSEVAVYAFGAGLLLAEATQMIHNKHVGSSWTAEVQHHLSGWNALDVSIVCLIGACACQRLPLITVVDEVEEQAGVEGSSSAEARSFAGPPVLLGLWVEDCTAGQNIIGVLCIAAWARLLGLMVISPDVGPLILMLVEMRADLRRFAFLCAAFVLGFGASISSLVLDDHHSSIDSLSGAIHSTFQGIIGTQDMVPVTISWEVEVVYTVYLVLAQVLLLNLLIAMFSSTYERIKANEIDEWRVARAQIILEYSHAVRGVFELPMLNLVGVAVQPLGWIWKLLRQLNCCEHVTQWSRVRAPWEPVQVPGRLEIVDGNVQASKCVSEIRAAQYVGTKDGQVGKVVYFDTDQDVVLVEWVDWTSDDLLFLSDVPKDEVVVTWDPKFENEAALEERGWRVIWGLPRPPAGVRSYPDGFSCSHGARGDASRAEAVGITRRRSLYDWNNRMQKGQGGSEDQFDEMELQRRWLHDEEDVDRQPNDLSELNSRVEGRSDEFERILYEHTAHTKKLAYQHSMKMMHLDSVIRDHQRHAAYQLKSVMNRQTTLEEKMQAQAAESNKRLDRLITMMSVMQNSMEANGGGGGGGGAGRRKM